jgi:hypothetical protein
MSESNPYLEISRRFNVPYGDVLCFRDAYIKKFENLDYWQQAAKRLQGTTVARAIIDQVNGIQYRAFHSLVIRNDGLVVRAIASDPVACSYNGRKHYVAGVRWLFEGHGDRLAQVEVGWDGNNELVFRNTDDTIRYGSRIIDVETEEVRYLGEEGLFFI